MNAVRDFGRGRGASDEHILAGSVRREQRSPRPKDPPPGGFSFRGAVCVVAPQSQPNNGDAPSSRLASDPSKRKHSIGYFCNQALAPFFEKGKNVIWNRSTQRCARRSVARVISGGKKIETEQAIAKEKNVTFFSRRAIPRWSPTTAAMAINFVLRNQTRIGKNPSINIVAYVNTLLSQP